MNTIDNSKLTLRRTSRRATERNVLRARVERKNYGADIELSDGRTGSLWRYAVSGCVMEAAVSWAKRHGAADVAVNG